MSQIFKALKDYKNLFYDVVGPAVTGTAVARVAVNAAYVVPSAARELVGVIPFILAEAPAAAEAIIAVWDIIGSDFKGQPCEGLYPVASGKLNTTEALETTPAEFWPIHAPMNGGEILNIGVHLLDALAANGEAFMTLVFATKRTGKRQIFGKFSRAVTGGTAAGETTSGTNLTLSNAGQMYELVASVVMVGVVVADLELAAYATMKCGVWDPIQSVNFFMAPVHALEAVTGATKVMSIQRLPFDAKFTNKQATIESTYLQYDAVTNATVIAHGIRYYGA